ncbi:MAG: hypothetical protein PHP59_00855 [Methanofollis sp.]|nr:hypothetical protein [Methanofollis sp.]MDD4253910.1 hypothetical protein [Methanofollis sp.]
MEVGRIVPPPPAGVVLAYARGWEEEMDHLSREILGTFLDGVVSG